MSFTYTRRLPNKSCIIIRISLYVYIQLHYILFFLLSSTAYPGKLAERELRKARSTHVITDDRSILYREKRREATYLAR